ncbi:MAG TPA: RNA methyltransferase [Bdellovibrionota bacterium]
MSDEKRPFNREKRPFGGKSKRPFGDKGKRFGGGDRPKRPFGSRDDRGPRRDRPPGEGPRREGFKKEGFRKEGFRKEGFRKFDDRDRGPRRERPPSEGPRREGFKKEGFRKFDDRAPRREDREPRRDHSPQRRDDSPFRGMHGGPKQEQDPNKRERPHLAENELRYHGKNACLALFKNRPDDIIRVYVLRELGDQFSELIEFCAKNRKSYHLVGEGDLERLTDSIHHQGICVIAKAKRFEKEEYFFRSIGAHRTLVIYLDGVANPHNLGAILRTAAHFGIAHVCVPKDEITKISAALYRTAEGAAEFVHLVRVDDPEKFLDRLHGSGFQLYAFEPGEGSQSLFETRLNEKSVFVFGAEVEGLSGLTRSIVETKLTIPGTGAVESLNVSVAAAVAIGEFARQGAQRAVRIVKNKP